jgi:hypothetical protein
MNREEIEAAAKRHGVPVPGWEDLYSITRDGRVWSVRAGRWLSPAVSPDGYRHDRCKADVVAWLVRCADRHPHEALASELANASHWIRSDAHVGAAGNGGK